MTTNKIYSCLIVLLFFIVISFLFSCRGVLSKNPPIHLNPNMDRQFKYTYQELARNYPSNTVAWGIIAVTSKANARDLFNPQQTVLKTGKTNNQYVSKAPLTVDMDFINRGQERYNIYCTPCHDAAGTGKGTVGVKGFAMPNFKDDKYISMPDGQIFDVIKNGYNTMPSYAEQIPDKDIWAIVVYLRSLQL